ncbi:MAG: hypothetical protein PGN26_02925 [Xylophilus ampelinus]
MNNVFFRTGVAFAVATLVGCGGGGGGSSPNPVALTVKVNGAVRAADASGQVSVAPGDQVEISSNQATNWNGASASGSTITLRNGNIASTVWTAQIVNGQASAGTYTLTGASAADASQAATVRLSVSAGDTRNGSYQVFATNGTRQTLALNFDVKTYEMNDPANAAADASGSFAANAAEAGTWDFVTPRGATAVTAKFRMTTDTVVGSFPFATAFAAAGSYSVQPFVASRALRTAQSALDGIYNRFGISITASGRDSTIAQMQIVSGGAQMKVCNDNTIYTIAACPSGSVITFNITPGSTLDRWNLTNVADNSNGGTFSVANVAGQNVYLNASSTQTAGTQLFRIGMLASNFAGGTARGGDTTGAWGTNTASLSAATSTGINAAGAALQPINLSLSASLQNTLYVGTPGGGNNYFLTQSGKIGAMIGARGNPATQGYLQIGLLD